MVVVTEWGGRGEKPGSTGCGPTTHVSSLTKEDLGRSARGVQRSELCFWCGEMEATTKKLRPNKKNIRVDSLCLNGLGC